MLQLSCAPWRGKKLLPPMVKGVPDLARAVAATGSAAGPLVGFDRGSAAGTGALTLATRLPRGLEQQGGWRDTAVDLAVDMADELTGNTFAAGTVPLSAILRDYPVALLVPTS